MKSIVAVIALCLLAGCEDKPPAAPPKPTAFDSQIKALEKARQAEGQVRAAEERRDEEVHKIQGY